MTPQLVSFYRLITMCAWHLLLIVVYLPLPARSTNGKLCARMTTKVDSQMHTPPTWRCVQGASLVLTVLNPVLNMTQSSQKMSATENILQGKAPSGNCPTRIIQNRGTRDRGNVSCLWCNVNRKGQWMIEFCRLKTIVLFIYVRKKGGQGGKMNRRWTYCACNCSASQHQPQPER